jgi:hypothetical protein
MKQTVKNACGTMAILHALINVIRTAGILVDPETFLAKFACKTWGMNPEERGADLENGDTSD